MKRISFTLPDELASALEREARRRGTSSSEIARRALAAHLGLGTGVLPTLSFAGVGRSGEQHTARNAEDILRREWGDGGRR